VNPGLYDPHAQELAYHPLHLIQAHPEALGNLRDRNGRISQHRARHRLVGCAELAPPATLAATGQGGLQAQGSRIKPVYP